MEVVDRCVFFSNVLGCAEIAVCMIFKTWPPCEKLVDAVVFMFFRGACVINRDGTLIRGSFETFRAVKPAFSGCRSIVSNVSRGLMLR